jgi:hypothetical protein
VDALEAWEYAVPLMFRNKTKQFQRNMFDLKTFETFYLFCTNKRMGRFNLHNGQDLGAWPFSQT